MLSLTKSRTSQKFSSKSFLKCTLTSLKCSHNKLLSKTSIWEIIFIISLIFTLSLTFTVFSTQIDIYQYEDSRFLIDQTSPSLQLNTDPLSDPCENTLNGPTFLTDSEGRTCTRSEISNGCCPSWSERFSCSDCDMEGNRCCIEYARCVSCCMGSIALDNLFRNCTSTCRTSSFSLIGGNKYRFEKHFCFNQTGPVIINQLENQKKWTKSII